MLTMYEDILFLLFETITINDHSSKVGFLHQKYFFLLLKFNLDFPNMSKNAQSFGSGELKITCLLIRHVTISAISCYFSTR